MDGTPRLLGGHFFGFAFLAHQFEFAFGFLDGGGTQCQRIGTS